MIPDWRGHRAFVVASGPSLTQGDVEKLRGENVIAVNCSIRLAPFAKILYACDSEWWNEYQSDWRGFPGLKVTIDKKVSRDFGVLVTDLPTGKPFGSGGYQAVHLAQRCGATAIYLLGFDCRRDGSSNHWHPDHRKGMNNPNDYAYLAWRKRMSSLHSELRSKGVSLINCSRETALTVPRKSLEEVLDGRC